MRKSVCYYTFTMFLHLSLRDLQQWLTASTHLFQSGSNSAGFLQHCGNCLNITCFKYAISSVGNAGRSRQPLTVHCFSTSGPNTASRANFTHRVPALLGLV